MYGLEENKMNQFEFDLEKEIKKKPAKQGEYIGLIEKAEQEIKNTLRGADKTKEFDDLGTLLLGYEAGKKVIKTISKQ